MMPMVREPLPQNGGCAGWPEAQDGGYSGCQASTRAAHMHVDDGAFGYGQPPSALGYGQPPSALSPRGQPRGQRNNRRVRFEDSEGMKDAGSMRGVSSGIESDDSESLCIKVSPCLTGLMDCGDSDSADEHTKPVHDEPYCSAGCWLRVCCFSVIYVLAAWTYYHGITQTTTEVIRFPGTPAEHTDIRNALRFIKDTYDRKWWLAFYVLFTTTIIIPAFKFWASLLVIHDMAHPAVPPNCFSRFHERILHVVCSYQMADAFCATLLSAALNTADPNLGRIIIVNIHSGFYNVVFFVILSVIFQHSSEVVRLMASPQPRLYPRVRARLDRVNVIVLTVVFFVTYWTAIGRTMMELRFHQKQLLFERNAVSLGQTVHNLLESMPAYVCYGYVAIVLLMPNIYMET
jgi:hypothetical protein